MKIVSGLGSIDEYIRLVEAGADEFFCGYVPLEWVETYGVMSPLNRREVLYYNVQIGAYSDMVILSRMVERYKVPVKITFNSLFYTPEQYPVVAFYIKQCMELGFDTFIIADIALILYLREHQIHCKIHLSGETAEVNRPMMEFFHSFDITRYIFHRKNTLEDMKSCINENAGKNLEYEAFVLNEMCHFTGGFCNSLHCDELTHMCKVPYQMTRFRKNRRHFSEVEKRFQAKEEEASDMEEEENGYVTGQTGCGLCALMRLKNVGITHLKLVGRGNYVDFMEYDIRQLKMALTILKECDQEVEFQNRVQQELFQHGCSKNCYYPLK
ncbi:MAG: U32 family peptidase [Clostridiales bacterium]|nr:U32 family peptidase [Clostridiales bacterium]